MSLPSNVKEKIERLIDEAIKDAMETVRSEIEKVEGEALKIIESSYKSVLKEAKEKIEAARRRAEVEAKKSTATADIKAKHMILNAKEEILDDILNEAKRVFKDFIGADRYKSFLSNMVDRAVETLGAENTLILVMEEDKKLIEDLIKEKKLKGKVEVKVDSQVKSGGFIAMTPDGRSKVDLTLDSIFESLKDTLRMTISKVVFKG